MSILIVMRTICDILGEMVGRKPGAWMERASPWIIGVVGVGMAGIMMYAWWTGDW